MKTVILRILLLSVLGIYLVQGLHNDEITEQSISMEDYLDQVTSSVNSEIDENSMMGHKPPNRWYYSVNPHTGPKSEVIDRLVEKGLAVLLQRHYVYLVKTRMHLAKLNNLYPDRIDLWPLKEKKAPAGNSSDDDHVDVEVVGWRQPEWIDDIFHELAESRAELEELFER